jgi:hypothetical protein
MAAAHALAGEWRGVGRQSHGSKYLADPPASLAGVLGAQMRSASELRGVVDFIGSQGESPTQPSDDSHFERFASIYRDYEIARTQDPNFDPAIQLLESPNTTTPPDPGDVLTPEERTEELALQGSRISDARTRSWAQLLNVRYRILLTFLHHYFLLGPVVVPGTTPSQLVRETLAIWAFEEMNQSAGSVKDLAEHLTTLPSGQMGKMAGAPFELPYTLDLPDSGPQRWRVHQDLIQASANIIEHLMMLSPDNREKSYLEGILERDGGDLVSGRRAFIERVKGLDV